MIGEDGIRFLRSTPVLKTADFPRAQAFYEGRLGYETIEEGGEPPRFGIFRRGKSVLFVDGWHGGPTPLAGVWDAYVHVAGLDDLQAEYEAAGAHISRHIEETVYGMREFDVTDPDGNVICFGEDTDPSAMD